MKALILFLVILISTPFSAQELTDTTFIKARTLTEKKNYLEAIALIEKLHSQFPDDQDISFFLAQLYFWNNDAEKAKSKVLVVYHLEPTNEDALRLLVQTEIALGQFENALIHASMGNEHFQENKNFYHLQKAIIYEKMDLPDQALTEINDIEPTTEEYKAAQYLRTQILRKQKNLISAGYLLTFFSSEDSQPAHLLHIEYLRKFNRYSQAIRLNYGDMFQVKALQLETDAYLKTSSSTYAYFNYGISEKNSIFPFIRLGGELYWEGKTWSTSAGARYLYFDQNNAPLLLTGHLAVRQQDWTFNYRPFVVFQQQEVLSSHIFYLRRSFETKESHLQLDLQYGTMPYYFFTSDVLTRINAYRLGVNSKFRYKDNWFFQPIAMYEWEEFLPDTYRHRLSLQFILSRRF